ncbi:MAG TPA: hypothetical protein VGT03_11970 [Candidatus Acidoferrales bacterium]|nr:hypothetical protein [Candidatus Acidoferrales bacterium]
MTKKCFVIVSGLGLVIVVALVVLARHFLGASYSGADRLLLLVPDDARFSDPRVTVWLDAAGEEGLHLVPMHDSSFLRPLFGKTQCAGVILPDSIHRQATDLFASAIHDYVGSGGKLMLVFDAGIESQRGFYVGDQSRFSDLAGINYGFYNKLRGKMIEPGEVEATIPVMDSLAVPPGKYYPLSWPSPQSDESSSDILEVQLRRYQYGDLKYPSFVTSGAYSGQVLLRSRSGIVAGIHPYGKGSVLFVNVPLGYLEGNTDGLPLHSFLMYFAARILSLPYLLPVPDGVGGLVLDWHIDSNAAIKALQEINSWHILQQGPYSMDFTAGPDTNAFGDKEGLDVPHNPAVQDLIREYMRLGEAIGSHGGWIHNYFAEHVDKDDPRMMEKYLELNRDALERVTGKSVVEYSAPEGNQPEWVTRWLEAHGFVAYYFTGDSGMGPTQGYRGGQRAAQDIWAFPILHLDRAASFEEMSSDGYSDTVILQWLDEVTEFVADHHQARLIYFHPPGIVPYHAVVHSWLAKAAQLRSEGQFRWYTMVQIAEFLNARKQVNWNLSDRDGQAVLTASHPHTLAHQSWLFPSAKFAEPSVIEGAATVHQEGDSWLLVAGEGTHLKAEARMLNP